jgi:hypothetical protein
VTSNATSAAVRDQLIQALELDLVGPSPALLAQLEAEGRTEEATELREELLDRPPNRWYQSGFPPLTPICSRWSATRLSWRNGGG